MKKVNKSNAGRKPVTDKKVQNKKIYVVLCHYKDMDNNSKIATFVEGVFSSKKLANKVGLTLVSNHLAKDAKDKVKGLQFLYYDVVQKRLDLSIHLL